MSEKQYRLQSASPLSLALPDADRLLALGDGECALLFIYILRCGGTLLPTEAARALGRSVEQIREAAARLGQSGLLSDSTEQRLPPGDQLPEYRSEDILRRSREDSAFRGLVTEAQRVLGHTLSTADLKTLFGIYDWLGMPPDVVMLLINHVAARSRRRYGEGRLPTMHSIEKEAFHWANQEILTAPQAEEYMARMEALDAEAERLRAALQISGREPSPSERRYMDQWLAMGYTTDALSIAYDRTIVATSKLSWAYMNKIVQSWYEKKLFTPAEIEKGDARAPRSGKAAADPVRRPDAAQPKGDDSERVARIFGQFRKE